MFDGVDRCTLQNLCLLANGRGKKYLEWRIPEVSVALDRNTIFHWITAENNTNKLLSAT